MREINQPRMNGMNADGKAETGNSGTKQWCFQARVNSGLASSLLRVVIILRMTAFILTICG